MPRTSCHAVFSTDDSKYRTIVEKIELAHYLGRPVLVSSRSPAGMQAGNAPQSC